MSLIYCSSVYFFRIWIWTLCPYQDARQYLHNKPACVYDPMLDKLGKINYLTKGGLKDKEGTVGEDVKRRYSKLSMRDW